VDRRLAVASVAEVGRPVDFLIYLVTSLLTVGVIFYNVNALIKGWLQMTGDHP